VSALSSALETDRSVGLGEVAVKVKRMLDEILVDQQHTATYGLPRRIEALTDLRELSAECSLPNWDGEGAAPVSDAVCKRAEHFLRSLPPEIPSPEVVAEPDGEIAFEWHLTPRRVFSVSISSGGRLSYAGLFGDGKTHGTEQYAAGEHIPAAILWNIHRLRTG
jgi:hypothetical protein